MHCELCIGKVFSGWTEAHSCPLPVHVCTTSIRQSRCNVNGAVEHGNWVQWHTATPFRSIDLCPRHEQHDLRISQSPTYTSSSCEGARCSLLCMIIRKTDIHPEPWAFLYRNTQGFFLCYFAGFNSVPLFLILTAEHSLGERWTCFIKLRILNIRFQSIHLSTFWFSMIPSYL